MCSDPGPRPPKKFEPRPIQPPESRVFWFHTQDPKPSRCPDCGPGTLILIRTRFDGGRPSLWYCCRCGADFFAAEVDKIIDTSAQVQSNLYGRSHDDAFGVTQDHRQEQTEQDNA